MNASTNKWFAHPCGAGGFACDVFLFVLASFPLSAQKIEFTTVVSKSISRTLAIPGEIEPFQQVALHARVPGYVERIAVDRGSSVKQGDLLVELSAPEMASRIAEAQARIEAAAADRLQAEAQLAATLSTDEKLKKAAETQGAIAGNELVQVQRQIEAEQALIQSRRRLSDAAIAGLKTLQDMQAYLRIVAPFDGIVTDRLVHPGALVGPGADAPLLVLQQISKLRLVVPVPEENSATLPQGAKVVFHVPAFPDKGFNGVVARSSHTLDPKTRTLTVELDVQNPELSLAPGMFPTVAWPIHRPGLALLVPATSIVTTTERTFVIRNQAGRAEWVDVKKGPPEGDLVEVSGALKPGDSIVKRASDETRDGSPLPPK
jgi:RND family efflux transporter MFP subunit